MRISVFGGSAAAPGSPPYQQALELGRMLAEAGYDVQTGGYGGVMEAVSRGASESGARVIGLTSDQIEAWRPTPPNHWIDEELRFSSAHQRLFAMVDSCHAALALPGGIGTLAEIAVLWKHSVITSPKPFILIGPGWLSVMDSFVAAFPQEIPPASRALLSFAPDNTAALERLSEILPSA
jgi:uncharacterized protein (TIGR00725 family)